jgi:hypothetical protein
MAPPPSAPGTAAVRAAPGRPAPPAPEPIASNAGCAEALAAWRQAGGNVSGGPDFGIALRGPPGSSLDLDRDLDLPVVSADAPSPPTCLLRVEATPLGAAAPRRVERATVHSEYRSGTDHRPNPDYNRLKEELDNAERNAKRPSGLLQTGEPELDLIAAAAGLLFTGIGKLVAEPEAQALQARLEATPRYLDAPRYEPYAYTVRRISTTRMAALEVTLTDRRTGAVERVRSQATESRTFEVADGRRARDRAVIAGGELVGPSASEIAAWERGIPQLRISTLAEALLDRAGAEETVVASAVPAPVADADAAGLDLPEPSAGPEPVVVEIEQAGGPSVGFYVRPDAILASSAGLGRSSLVGVRQPGGAIAYGLVARTDASRGLALIHIDALGRPTDLYQGDVGIGSRLTAVTGPRTIRRERVVGTSIENEAEGGGGGILYLDLAAGAAPVPPGTPFTIDGHIAGIAQGGGGGEPRVLHPREIAAFLAGS